MCLGEYFLTGHVVGRIRKAEVIGFFVDENLMIQVEVWAVAKQTRWHNMSAIMFQPIEQMTAADFAECPSAFSFVFAFSLFTAFLSR